MKFTRAWNARHYWPDFPDDLESAMVVPPVIHIGNRDWWVKVLGMCSHNWALVDAQYGCNATVYFFHDRGMHLSKSPYKRIQTQGRSAVVDSLVFDSIELAKEAMKQNGFARLLENPGPWFASEPMGHFYDARKTEEGIYSRKGYWQK
jgi:hypothetical protein